LLDFAFLPIDSHQGQIRLLKVSPGQDSDVFHCSYEISNVNDGEGEDVPYETVSYVWGKIDSKRTILIDNMAVELTENLFDVLRRIRHASSHRYLWVDALCINQEDDVEKTAQVDMMHQIYSRCAQCNIWMGHIDAASLGLAEPEAVEAAKGALDVIRILAGEDLGPDLPPHLSTTAQQYQAGKAMKVLMAAAWWTRIWTVQEATSPKNLNVLWGPLSIPWRLLMKAAEELIADKHHTGEGLDFFEVFPDGDLGFFTSPIIGLRIASEWAEEPETTLNMLWRFRYRDSTDPRDKVYVILNLVPAGTCPLPSVPSSDYGVSTPLLYRRVMLDLLREEWGLRCLIGMRGEAKTIPGLPSWVIDWSLPRDGLPLVSFWEHNYFYFSYTADKGLPMLDVDAMMSLEFGDDVLNINGLFFDKVLVCSDIITEGDIAVSEEEVEEEEGREEGEEEGVKEKDEEKEDEEKEREEEEDADEEEAEELEEEDEEKEDRLHEICTKLIAKALAEDPRHRIISEVYWRQALHDIVEGNVTDETGSFNGEPANEYWHNYMLINQCLFITENGAVGLGPSTTSVGDEVWILSGGRSPFLLGPLPARGEGVEDGVRDRDASYHYHFRGDVFVPGIMGGEAVTSRIENQRFVHIH
jgi:hypothetical protein